jgi:hypothetical protein
MTNPQLKSKLDAILSGLSDDNASKGYKNMWVCKKDKRLTVTGIILPYCGIMLPNNASHCFCYVLFEQKFVVDPLV